MARTSKANAVANDAVESVENATNENMNDNQEDSPASDTNQEDKHVESKKSSTKEKETAPKVAELTKEDEIGVVSLIPNVSYKEKATGDFYTWSEPGQVETMTYGTLQNMWRETKSYFRNMWLKPLDDRVVKKFNLKSIYDKYDFLMDGENYTIENVDKICDSIKSTPAQLKQSLCNKVKNLVTNGEVTDVNVIREIEKSLNIDLISLIG